MFQGKRKSMRYCTAKSCLNPHSSKQGYSHDITLTWSLKENLLVFLFTWTFCKWTHFHTFQPTPYSKISQLMSHPPARPTLTVITPVWRASIQTPRNNQKWNSATITVTGPISRYFLGATRVRALAVSLARLICPAPTTPVFASVSHFTFLMEKSLKCARKQREAEVHSPFAELRREGGWGMFNTCHDQTHYLMAEQRLPSSLTHMSGEERDGETITCLLAPNRLCNFQHVCMSVLVRVYVLRCW